MKRTGPEGGFEPREIEAKKQKRGELYERVSSASDEDDFSFSLQLDPLKEKPAIEEYFEIVQEGPNKGKSAVWFLVNSTDEPNPFIAFWKKFNSGTGFLASIYTWMGSPPGPTAQQLFLFSQALFSKPEHGEYKGRSAFSMLTAKVGHPYDMQMFERFKQDVSLEDLPDDFLNFLLDKHYEIAEQTLLDILEKNHDEESIRKSLHFLLAGRDTDLFREILERFGEVITLDLWSNVLGELVKVARNNGEINELLITTLDYLNRKNLLSKVVKYLKLNSADIGYLTTILWERFNAEGLDLDLLLKRDQDDKYPLKFIGKDIVFLQMAKKYFEEKEISWFFSNNLLDILVRWLSIADQSERDKLLKQIDHTHLLTPIEGITLLQHIVYPYICTEVFAQVWKKFEDKIKITDLTYHSANQGSVFRQLAREKAPVLELVCDKFGDKITLQFLLDEIAPERYFGEISTFFLFVSAASSDLKNTFIVKMLKRQLKQDTGIIPNEYSHSESLHELLHMNLPMLNVDELIRARNDLFTYLSGLNEIEPAENNYNELMIRGKAAFEAGYVNAFYDIGQYYISRGQLLTGYQVFENVPPESCHYQSVSSKLAAHYLGAFTNDFKNKNLLKEALGYAIRLADENDHNQQVNRLAYYYMFNDNERKMTPDRIVPDNVLMAMNPTTGVEDSIKLLDDLKRIKLLESQVAQLQAFKLSKESVPVIPSENEALHCSQNNNVFPK